MGWKGGVGSLIIPGVLMATVYGSTFGWVGRVSPLILGLRLDWVIGFLFGMIDGALSAL